MNMVFVILLPFSVDPQTVSIFYFLSPFYFTTRAVGHFIAFLVFSTRPLEDIIIQKVLILATRNTEFDNSKFFSKKKKKKKVRFTLEQKIEYKMSICTHDRLNIQC